MAGIKGMDSLLRKLNKISDVAKSEIMEKAVKSGAKVVQAQAKELAPVDTGELRNSIKVKTNVENGKIQGIVYTNKEYAPYVEFGTGPVGEANKPDLPPEVASEITYKQEGWHTPRGYTQGQKPQPFLYPALESSKDKVNKAVKNSIRKEINKIARGG